MRNIIALILCTFTFPLFAASPELDTAITKVRTACNGISDAMADMKKMAGINTAVTGVGTAAGVGATAVGIVKASKDKEAEETKQVITELEDAGYKRIETEDELLDVLAQFFDSSDNTQLKEMADALRTQRDRLDSQSKKLGNIRTGLMATNTATNIAGAVIAAGNRIDIDLTDKIAGCIESVDELSRVRMSARVDGTASEAQLSHSQEIIANCGEWYTANFSAIDKRATGAAASSGVGAGVGLIGTIISAQANSEKVRSGDYDKEKRLNNAANIMAGTTTVASGVATVFNATQIGAIRRAAEIADKCEGVLE